MGKRKVNKGKQRATTPPEDGDHPASLNLQTSADGRSNAFIDGQGVGEGSGKGKIVAGRRP